MSFLWACCIAVKHYGDPCDYEYYFIKGDTVLVVQWQIPGSADPNAVVIGFTVMSIDEFNSYEIADWPFVYSSPGVQS